MSVCSYCLCNECASECREGAEHTYLIPSTARSTCAVTVACASCRVLRKQLHHMLRALRKQLHHVLRALRKQLHHMLRALRKQLHHMFRALRKQLQHMLRALRKQLHHMFRALRKQLHHMFQLNTLWLLFCVIFVFYILVRYTRFSDNKCSQ